ncbi:MAG TPA: hypothetical protein VGZ04_08830 [Acidimicrobiales bacterium]|nr:hypothetical protein [Acidimicrobiales bacterium]
MSALTHRRYSRNVLNRLIDEAPSDPHVLTDDHRRSLSARFRGVASADHRRLDAWMVERAGQPLGGFRWSPTTAKRVIGNAALRRSLNDPTLTRFDAVDIEVTDQLLRVASGYARGGSLASYLAQSSPSVLGLVSAEAANWTTQLGEAAESIDAPWSVATSDAYYDVARARTTLRGRRDLIVTRGFSRILIRVRAGAPGKSAGPGLRADLTIDALAESTGLAATRVIGLWPEAGVVLSVDGTMEDLRSGARDLVRTAVAHQRQRLALAA